MKTFLTLLILVAMSTAATANEIKVGLGKKLTSSSGFASGYSVTVAACHNNNQFTLTSRQKWGYEGYQTSIRLGVGDKFVVYDNDLNPVVVSLTAISDCIGTFQF